jgi:2-C-methyl-D-erythritol 4-phosphate cytidylyltransferase
MADHWAVVPAAGRGARMASEVPKQYLPLRGRPVIAHTLERLAGHPAVRGVAVVLGADDCYWPTLGLDLPVPLLTAVGGAERCHSVLAGLEVLAQRAAPLDWVLVHDAARPCVRREDLDRLMDDLADHPVGGLLALPVSDTVKRTDARGEVLETVDRSHLWRAATPQMFRLGPLTEALRAAIADGVLVTDEAAAMERLGRAPRVVECHPDNLKVTRPADLALAELFLARQERER